MGILRNLDLQKIDEMWEFKKLNFWIGSKKIVGFFPLKNKNKEAKLKTLFSLKN